MKLSIEINSQVIQIDIPESICEVRISQQNPQISCKDCRYPVNVSFLPLDRKQCETSQRHSSHRTHQRESMISKLARCFESYRKPEKNNSDNTGQFADDYLQKLLGVDL